MRELLEEPLTLIHDESTAGLTIETDQPERLTGRVIREGERIVYASLPVAKSGSRTTNGEQPRRSPFEPRATFMPPMVRRPSGQAQPATQSLAPEGPRGRRRRLH